ncbi:serine/threonine protein kinase [Archangium lipolyticum]|uniref:serine/threonine protein kinase n=1 Tax=Archangium lipolyticum TaxID=2970465 RepID=UPI00214A03C8|nr:serine/threonine-protein kinase [Archangium lipolyticum]
MHETTTFFRPEALPSGTDIGQWRVVEPLGVGGYGAVYRVEDIHHPRLPLALKVALRREDPRAQREAVLLMEQAVHPNVVRFHGCGRWPDPKGHTFHVMDLVPGPPLDRWAETLNPSFLQFAEAGAKLAGALGELHGRGVLHRDVKPENILIREPDGEPVLVDFGIGTYAGATSLTSTPLPPGTTHLRSPEAMRFWVERGKLPGASYEVGAADDLYALGVSLYRAVTGHYPFPPELLGDLLPLAITRNRPHAPRDFNRRVPQALSDVLVRMLAKNPRERYATGAEVRDALVEAASFGRRAAWEASLFEWEPVPAREAGEAPGRRIRRPAFPTSPMTVTEPGVRLLEGGSSVRRRRRGAPAPAPEARQASGRALPGRALVGVLGLGLALPGIWVVLGNKAPAPLPPEPVFRGGEVARAPEPSDAGSAAAPLPLESTPAAAAPVEARAMKGAPMKKPQQMTPDASPQREPGSAGKALGTAACVGLACASAQTRPASTDCPPESRIVMRELRLAWGDGPSIITDIQQDKPTPDQPYTTVRSGSIVSRTRNDRGLLPRGTLLFGELFTEGPRVYGRYERAQTPDGKEYPVCFILGNVDAQGEEKLPGSRPGAARIPGFPFVTAVKRFVYKEPGENTKQDE